MTVAVPAVAPASPVVVAAVRPGARWDAYVSSRPDATAYHRSAWAGVIERTFFHETRYLTAESSGEIVGILPIVLFRSRLFGRFAISMPFLNYGGVVADTTEAAEALLDAAITETRRAGCAHLELRHTHRIFDGLTPKLHKVAMVLPLAGTIESQWQALDRKIRNQVRKAEKSDLRIQRGGVELVPAFYEVFARNMRDLGTPVYSARFFEEICRSFPGDARVVSVWLGARPVAAGLLLAHGRSIEVPWASSIRDYNARCPNVLLYWNMLRWAIEDGFDRFNFGRSTPFEGTYEFKRQWGAEPKPLVWEYWLADGRPLPDLSPKNPKFERAISAWKRLPLGVARLLGPAIVRHIP